MTQVVLDQNAVAKLQPLRERVCVLDPRGTLVGYFWPASTQPRGFCVPEMSDEEIERRVNEPGGRSLSEIMADLEKRP